MQTLLDILDEAAARYGDRPALALRRDDGVEEQWSYRGAQPPQQGRRVAPARAGLARASGC